MSMTRQLGDHMISMLTSLVIPKFGITETSIESNVTLDMNGKNIISSVDPATDIFQIVFDAHDDGDTFIANSTNP